jgi:hypothetical protein
MLISKVDSEFEVSIYEIDGEWEGLITEHNIHRVISVSHLQHRWTSLEAALTGLQRRWLRLFPDDPPPDFRAAIAQPLISSCPSY